MKLLMLNIYFHSTNCFIELYDLYFALWAYTKSPLKCYELSQYYLAYVTCSIVGTMEILMLRVTSMITWIMLSTTDSSNELYFRKCFFINFIERRRTCCHPIVLASGQFILTGNQFTLSYYAISANVYINIVLGKEQYLHQARQTDRLL